MTIRGTTCRSTWLLLGFVGLLMASVLAWQAESAPRATAASAESFVPSPVVEAPVPQTSVEPLPSDADVVFAADDSGDLQFEEFGDLAEFGRLHVSTTSVFQRYIVRVADEPALTRIVADLGVLGADPIEIWHDVFFGFVIRLDSNGVEFVRAHPGVVDVELDSLVSLEAGDGESGDAVPGVAYAGSDGLISPAAVQNDLPLGLWGLDRIDQRARPLDSTYSPAATGAGVTAYVVDSGLRLGHVEFTGRVGSGAFFNFDDGTGVSDCLGHGTHVSGTIGGSTYGVAKSVTIVPVKVFGCSGSTTEAIVISGINWVIDNHAAGTPAVANLSLGGPASSSMDAAVQALINDGVTVVAAAGNSGRPACDYSPGRLPAAITVAASEIDDDDADYSNYGSCNDLFAPGTGVLSAWFNSNTASRTISGTSMAAPHVAGAAALILGGVPSATPAQVWTAIDAATTRGAISECCSDPDKLLYVVPLAPPSAPSAVSGVAGNSSVAVSWTPPASNGGSSITGYTVRSSPDATTCTTTGATSCTVTGLTNGTTYTFTVTAANMVGTGPASPASPPITPAPTVPGAPSTAPQPSQPPTPSSPPSLSSSPSFVPLTPTRVLDTRAGAKVGNAAGTGAPLTLSLFGKDGLPAGGIGAVALNVTVVAGEDPTIGGGYVTVYPCGTRPDASNLNFVAGQTIANTVIAPVSASGEVCFHVYGTAHLLADVSGYFST